MTVVGPLLVNPGRIRKEGGEVRRARLALVAPRRAPPGTHTPTTFNFPDGGGVCGTSVKYDLGAEPQRNSQAAGGKPRGARLT